jgi:hypothetical protein
LRSISLKERGSGLAGLRDIEKLCCIVNNWTQFFYRPFSVHPTGSGQGHAISANGLSSINVREFNLDLARALPELSLL